MARLNKLLTGHQITDEVINRADSTSLPLGHDTILNDGTFEIWTGASGAGSQLTLTTDYTLGSEDTRLTTEAGETVYTKLAIVNGAYQSTDLYVTYKTVGDYASVESVSAIASEVINLVYPIGCYYTQYPDASSNTDATEFPTTQRPATLFGGTWEEQWPTESVFFRTRGLLSDNQRTNGLQDDAVRNVTGNVTRTNATNGYPYAPSASSGPFYQEGSTTSSNGSPSGHDGPYTIPKFDLSRGIAGGTPGTPDTVHALSGSIAEARGRNRRIKVWKRTA